jgi:hypothetical protein
LDAKPRGSVDDRSKESLSASAAVDAAKPKMNGDINGMNGTNGLSSLSSSSATATTNGMNGNLSNGSGANRGSGSSSIGNGDAGRQPNGVDATSSSPSSSSSGGGSQRDSIISNHGGSIVIDTDNLPQSLRRLQAGGDQKTREEREAAKKAAEDHELTAILDVMRRGTTVQKLCKQKGPKTVKIYLERANQDAPWMVRYDSKKKKEDASLPLAGCKLTSGVGHGKQLYFAVCQPHLSSAFSRK